MKRITKIALGVAAATTIAGALAIPVLAHGPMNFGRMGGMHQGMQMEGHMQMGEMGQGQQHMMGMMNGHGPMMGGHDGAAMMAEFDTDGDGVVSPEEARAGLTAKLEQYDADGNGTLSLEEFEVLHNDAGRTAMVDRFQWLDDDGDGQVTGDEITRPAEMFAHRQEMHDSHGMHDGDHDGMHDGHADHAGKRMMEDN